MKVDLDRNHLVNLHLDNVNISEKHSGLSEQRFQWEDQQLKSFHRNGVRLRAE
jgi:hypothetical protein